jgi:type I restriction enzyme, S subunit
MIYDFRHYPAYKASGTMWLGDVPRHWAVRRQRNVAAMRVSNVDKHSKEGEDIVRLCNYTDVYKNDRISEQIPFTHATATRAEFEHFRLEVGDVLITKDSEAWDDIGVPALVEISAPDLVCGYHLALLRPYQRVMQGAFLFRSQQSLAIAYQYHVSANGVTRFGLSHDAIKSILLPIPPLSEQHAIVRFLDYADRRIQRYIRTKKKLIALLNEQKQAIIHRAVTRGLDPSVRLKPSGVEWLEDVPEHWEVRRLKKWITPIEQGWSPQCDAQPAGPNDWGVLKVGCVNRECFDAKQNKKLPETLAPIPELEIRDGDILVSRANTRDLLGLATVVAGVRAKLLLSDKLFRFRPLAPLCDAQFLVLAIRGKTSRAQIESSANGASASMQNIGQDVIRNLWLAIPPKKEQQQIVQALTQQTADMTRAILHAQREIDLLREYRTRLIADVVTGKLDVREAAARLPEEAEEPSEESEALAADDEEGEDVDLDTVEDLEA